MKNDMGTAMLETARMFLEAGLPAQAATVCKKALALDPCDPTALHLLGSMVHKQISSFETS